MGNAISNYKCDVFLNHRGPDTKKTIASSLYWWLTSIGLQVFLDCQELEGGRNLETQIKEAIASASLHVAIFSPRYAESTWCLEELHLMTVSGKPIIPIFYQVKPRDLRGAQKHRGAYAAALDEHESKIAWDGQPRHNSTTVLNWRNALFCAAEFSGFELDALNGDWGVLLFKVVECVFKSVEKPRILQISYEMRYRSGRMMDNVNTIGMHDQPRAMVRNLLKYLELVPRPWRGIKEFTDLRHDMKGISHSSNLLELISLFCNYENQSRMTMHGLQMIVLRVELGCMKCRRRAMTLIAGFEGVYSFAMDVKEMKLAVIGSLDPVCIVDKLRNFGNADLLSVGPAQMKFRRSEYKSMLRDRL